MGEVKKIVMYIFLFSALFALMFKFYGDMATDYNVEFSSSSDIDLAANNSINDIQTLSDSVRDLTTGGSGSFVSRLKNAGIEALLLVPRTISNAFSLINALAIELGAGGLPVDALIISIVIGLIVVSFIMVIVNKYLDVF